MITNKHDAPPPPVLRLSDRSELIEAVPYLLGFQPTQSVVFIGVTENGESARVVVAARVDLPDVLEAGLVDQLAEAMHRATATTVIVVCFGDALVNDPGEVADQLHDITTWLTAAGLCVADVLAVGPEHWCSITGGGSGRRIGGSAEAIGAGMPAPKATRTEVLAALTPAIDGRPTLQRDLDSAESSPKAEPEELFAFAATLPVEGEPVRMSSVQLARFAVALTDVAVRDAIWLALDAHHVHSGQLAAMGLEIGTRCPGRHASAGLFLFAWQRWRAGDGVLAAEAAERAVAAAGGRYTAAELLLDALGMGLNPITTPRLQEGDGDQ